MRSLIEELPAEIARLEAKHGSQDPFVQDLKEQLRAMKTHAGPAPLDTYRMQAVDFSTPAAPQPDDPNRPETEADGQRAGALRIARFRHQNAQLKRG